jgi:hypothetical protein
MFGSRALNSIAFLACGLALAADAALGSDASPYLGTWVLNRAKSNFHGDPGYQSQTMTVTEAGGGMLHYAFDSVDSDGKSSHVEYGTMLDGKSYPIANSAFFDSNKSEPLGPRKVKWTVMKDGKPVAWGVDRVSKDGKTKYETENWQHDGKLFSYQLVFDRQ